MGKVLFGGVVLALAAIVVGLSFHTFRDRGTSSAGAISDAEAKLRQNRKRSNPVAPAPELPKVRTSRPVTKNPLPSASVALSRQSLHERILILERTEEGKPAAEQVRKALERLDRAMQKPDPVSRLQAITILIKETKSINDIMWVRAAVGMMVATGAKPEQVYAALEEVYQTVEPEVLEPVDDEMQAMNTSAYVTSLVDVIGSSDNSRDLQIHAVEQVGGMLSDNSYPSAPLVTTLSYTALSNPDPEVRRRTLEILRDTGDDSSVTPLTVYRDREQDESLRTLATEAIAAIQSR